MKNRKIMHSIKITTIVDVNISKMLLMNKKIILTLITRNFIQLSQMIKFSRWIQGTKTIVTIIIMQII